MKMLKSFENIGLSILLIELVQNHEAHHVGSVNFRPVPAKCRIFGSLLNTWSCGPPSTRQFHEILQNPPQMFDCLRLTNGY